MGEMYWPPLGRPELCLFLFSTMARATIGYLKSSAPNQIRSACAVRIPQEKHPSPKEEESFPCYPGSCWATGGKTEAPEDVNDKARTSRSQQLKRLAEYDYCFSPSRRETGSPNIRFVHAWVCLCVRVRACARLRIPSVQDSPKRNPYLSLENNVT